MKASAVKKLIGQQVSVRKCHSGITQNGIVLSVKGRNAEIDFYGMTDWLWLPDCVIEPTSEDA